MSTEDKTMLLGLAMIFLFLLSVGVGVFIQHNSERKTCYELAQDKTLCDKKYFKKE